MCLPISFLKWVVKLNAFITISLGIMALITGIMVGKNTSESNPKNFLTSFSSPRASYITSMYIFGIVTSLIGVIGWYGGYKKNACLLAIYNICNIVFLWVFMIIALAAFLSADKFIELDGNDCASKDWSHQIQQVAKGATDHFCQKDCPCGIDVSKFEKDYFGNSSFNFSGNSTVLQFSDCPLFTQYPKNETNIGSYDLMTAAEKHFGCAGWCHQSIIFQFSDVNNGSPSQTCFVMVANWIKSYGQLIGAICFTIASILFLTVIFTCCLCLHPAKKKDQASFYQRMAYYND